MFSHCHSEEVADSIKAVFIGGLHEVLTSDSAKSQGALMQVCVCVCVCVCTLISCFFHVSIIFVCVLRIYVLLLPHPLYIVHTHTTYKPMYHQYTAENLQMVLEVAESPVLLEAVVKNITTLSQTAPQFFAQHFKVRIYTMCTMYTYTHIYIHVAHAHCAYIHNIQTYRVVSKSPKKLTFNLVDLS